MKTGPLLFACLCVFASSGRASGVNQELRDRAAALGIDLGDAPAQPIPVPTPPSASPAPALPAEPVEFQCDEVIDKLERETFRRTVVGRGRKKRVVLQPIENGVTPADRVERKQISKIVVHASGGVVPGKDGCQGSVGHLLTHGSAAHYIVCRDGRIIRMVPIDDIANHVKDDAMNNISVGIETESAYPSHPVFRPGDWDPQMHWRLTACLATVIRAVSKETGVQRDTNNIMTHGEVDVPYCKRVNAKRKKGQKLCSAHEDPGPLFLSESVPTFGDLATQSNPRANLMRLVLDDTVPVITLGNPIKASDASGLGHVLVWSLDEKGGVVKKISDWRAFHNIMPPNVAQVPSPTVPGKYRAVARDLSGNTAYEDFEIKSDPAGGMLISQMPAPTPVAVARAEEAYETRMAALEQPRGSAVNTRAYAAP